MKKRRFLMQPKEEVTIKGLFSTTSKPAVKAEAGKAYKEAMDRIPNNDGNCKTSIKVVFVDNTTANVIDRAILPNELKIAFPFMLFLAWDLPAYSIMNKIYPFGTFDPTAGISAKWYFVNNFVYGAGFTGFNNSDNYCKRGDFVQQYFSNFGGSFSAYVIISSELQSYSAILEESKKTMFVCPELLYFTDNILNYNQPLNLVSVDPLGVYKVNQYMPFSFKTIDIKQPDFISIRMNLRLNRFNGVLSIIDFNTNIITIEFKMKF